MKFYRENQVNPFASCLPMVAQLPVFLALYYMLRVDLRYDICPAINPPGSRQSAAVRRDAGVELPLHPRPDRQGHGRRARRADRALRRVAARLDAADVRHRGQEPAEDLPGAAVPVRRLHLAVPGRPARLLDHDEPVDDPAAVDHQEAPRAAARGSHGRCEGGQGGAGRRPRTKGKGKSDGKGTARAVRRALGKLSPTAATDDEAAATARRPLAPTAHPRHRRARRRSARGAAGDQRRRHRRRARPRAARARQRGAGARRERRDRAARRRASSARRSTPRTSASSSAATAPRSTRSSTSPTASPPPPTTARSA